MENENLNVKPRILICTIVDDWNNYGQRLQAYALCKFINNQFDVECRVCDYRRNTDEAPSFSQFQKTFIPTVYARSKEDIYTFKPDLILLGSDQVLNHNIIDLRSHCHGILEEFENVSTYAAGEVGWSPTREPTNILTPNDKNKFAIRLLSRCNRVSVRDESTVKALSGKIGEGAVFSIDPVFLESATDWIKIAKKPDTIKENEIFDFAYWICGQPDDVKLDKDVKTYICVGQTREKKRFSPQEFLWLIAHCRKLYTNSFHGCAFGLIFNKNMALAKKDDKRIANLMNLLKTEGRDWEKINKNIEFQRKISFSYLKDVVYFKKQIVIDRKKCSGCMLCAELCEAEAIEQTQINGFRYPKIDIDKCVGCERCRDACKLLHAPATAEICKTILSQSIVLKDVNNSSAGGFVKTLSKHIIKKGGVSYGVVFSKDFKDCYFTRADSADMVEFQTRSKYLEPSVPNYKQIKTDVASGRLVLFTGTQCQVAAVKNAVGDSENLITVSLICYAMPSAAEWRKYLTRLEKQHNSYTVYVNQRYGIQELYIVMLNGHVIYQPGRNEWVEKFTSNREMIRPSCLTCKFKYPNIQSDFIVGDSWGIDKKANGIPTEKAGIVFFINDKAQSVFDEISASLKFRQLNTEDVLQTFKKTNPMLTRSKGQV